MRFEDKANTDWLKPWRQKRIHLMGVPVDPLTRSEIIELFEATITYEKKITLANLNLHGLYCSEQSKEMTELLHAPNTIVHIDGMPIVWLGILYGHKLKRLHRNTPLDFLPEMLRICAKNDWRVAFIGSKPGLEDENLAALLRIAPGLTALCMHGYFHTQSTIEGSEALDKINNFEPNLILAGLGMPRQETWLWNTGDNLQANVLMPVGGFIDLMAGRLSVPPRFFGHWGFEWLWRLLTNSPTRVGFRYIVEPILLIGIFIRRKFWVS